MTQKHKAIISRLTISGFKSFADEVSLDILPGLTGIVGPNGCGKSNIVESLRWVMGESSARALRGNESDDLIFAGTHARPARNIAKVTLRLTQSTGLAPAPFHESDELDITRQAERSSGNLYRINQKTMRAKDVQTLFADLSSGARSSSIISQNRVGELINAKPNERRLLLDEAAGITGLHVRRHDAELKLKQAEQNLERVEEHRQTLEARLHILSEQSQNARHYRQISDNIRLQEEKLLILNHQHAALTLQNNQKSLKENALEKEKIQNLLEKFIDEQRKIHNEKISINQKIEEIRPILQNKKIEKEINYNNLEHIIKNTQEKERNIKKLQEDIKNEENNKLLIEKERNQYLSKIENFIPELEIIQKEIAFNTQKIKENEKEYNNIKNNYEELNLSYQETYLEYNNIKNNYNIIDKNIKQEIEILNNLTQELSLLKENKEKLEQEEVNFIDIEKLHHEYIIIKEELDTINLSLQKIQIDEELATYTYETQQKEAEKASHRKIILQKTIEEMHQKNKDALQEKEKYLKLILSKEKEENLHQTQKNYEEKLQNLEQKEIELLEIFEKNNAFFRKIQKEKEETEYSSELYQKEKIRLTHALEERQNTLSSAEEISQKLIKEKEELPNIQNITHLLEEKNSSLNNYKNEILQYSQNIDQINIEKNDLEAHLLKIHTKKLEIESEMNGIIKTLHHTSQQNHQSHSLLEKISCPKIYQKALASALTEDLDAILLSHHEEIPPNTPRAWYPLPSQNTQDTQDKNSPSLSLPTLADYVTAPHILEQTLKSFFIIDKNNDKNNDPLILQKKLHKGEALIDKNGNLWRWDGFIRTEHARSSTEIKLIQTQKLQELKNISANYENEEKQFKEKHLKITNLLASETEKLLSIETKTQTLQIEIVEYETSIKDLKEKAHYIDVKQIQNQEYINNISNDYKNILKDSSEIIEKINLLPNLAELSSQEIKASQELENSQNNLTDLRHEKQILQKKYHLFLQEKETALLQHINAAKQIDNIHYQETQYYKELENTQKELLEINNHTREEDIKNLLKKINNYKIQKKEITDKKDSIEEKLKNISSYRIEKENNYQKHKNNLLIITEKSHHLTQQIIQQEKKLTRLTHQKELYQKQIKDLSSCENDQKTLEKIKEKLQSQSKILENLHQECAQYKERESQLTQEKQKLTHQIDIQGKTLHYINKNLADLKQRLAEISNENTTNLETLKEEYEKETYHLQLLEQEFSSLEEMLKNIVRNEKINLKNQHDIKDELQKLNTQDARLSERLKQAEQNIQKLQNETPLPEKLIINEIKIPESDTTLRQIIQKLQNTRDKLGAVNLCAEEEFNIMDENYRTLLKEQNDLTEAISRLRKAVNSLNREGRERLAKTFKEINDHFQKLFTRMFGGGQAHIKLVGHDDALEAGLEIFAQPPGKKLTSLSLLSGGEQALTALSLIFAAFHCNPAPIYILDEVDAPLDDANIERFCSLLTEIATKTGTRFLVVTHHQLTMAHMDRLFGVTMQERGVSRLLSVNLSETIALSNS